MALRQDKDRAKTQQEKLQAILSAMLKDEDNKYCEDCDAKGPRWASWNLGIFLCIRCAGIHRNLGVHISRVKSVNLDSWTAEQVAMMHEMGNSRARAVYEANVPDDFQRPQSNSTIEIFIRAKYEAKKFIAREWVPPKPAVPKEWIEEDVTEKKRPRSKPSSSASPSSVNQQNTVSSTRSIERRGSAARPAAVRASDPKPAPPQPVKASSGASDLLGLDFSVNEASNTEIAPAAGTGGQGGDLLLDLFGASSSAPLAQGTQPSAVPPQQNGFAEPNLFEKGSGGGGSGSGEQEEKKSTKDSIMALFGNGRMQPQVFGVPGVATMSRPLGGKGRASTSSAWTNNPFLYPEANFYQACYVASSPYYYPSAGGVYLPQQQMYGSGGMQPPIMQQQQGMMGMQPGMMGQPVQQGMMGMHQPAGSMYGGQMCGNMMVSGPGYMQPQVPQPAVAQQFNPMQQPVSTPAMAPPLNAMQQPVSQPAMALQLNAMLPPVTQPVARQLSAMQPPASQPAMPRQQHYPMPQQMHFQQMQQQMANMTLGGSSMAGMHQPQPTAVGGRSWGGAATGHTLSSSLWQ